MGNGLTNAYIFIGLYTYGVLRGRHILTPAALLELSAHVTVQPQSTRYVHMRHAMKGFLQNPHTKLLADSDTSSMVANQSAIKLTSMILYVSRLCG
jgi:hypothetical protein